MMSGVDDAQREDFEKRLKESSAERAAEWEAVKKQFPINPNDPPEVQRQMWVKQQAAMLDP